MRINNKRVIPWVEALYALLLLAVVAAAILVVIPIGIVVSYASPYLIVGFFIIILFLFYRLGPQHLEYDSDGEVIHIQTEDVFWSKYFPRKKTTMDFPKNKLISFRIQQTFPKKTLELFVKSKRSPNGVTKLRFNITYLSSAEISDMKRSLSKIVRNNRELTTHIEETADDE